MPDSKRYVYLNPDSFDGDAPALVTHNLDREGAAAREGAIVADVVSKPLGELPEWLFPDLEEQAMARSVTVRQFTRSLSDHLVQPCNSPELSLAIKDTYNLVRRRAIQTADRDLKDLLKISSGYYASPSDKYQSNKPCIAVYPWAKEELINVARITGDADWTDVAMANLSCCLCEFGDVPHGHKELFRAQERRRQYFIEGRYGMLLRFVPKDAPLWLKMEAELVIRRTPGLMLAEIARSIGYKINTPATRQRLLRLLRSLVRSGAVTIRGRKYYPNE